jgi:hypothetical protein
MEAHVPVRTRIPAELRLIDPVEARRRAPRASVSIEASLGDASHGSLCRITDLSLHGARLQTFGELRADHLVRLTLPNGLQKSARIVWFRDFEAGCQFEQPLTDVELAELTAS